MLGESVKGEPEDGWWDVWVGVLFCCVGGGSGGRGWFAKMKLASFVSGTFIPLIAKHGQVGQVWWSRTGCVVAVVFFL